MAAIETIDGPDSRTTVTQAPSFGSGHDSGLMDFYKQLLAKKAQAVGIGGAPGAGPVMDEAAMSRMHASAPSGGGGWSGRAPKSQLDLARERDELLRIQARQNPAPMRMVTGAGITPGYVMDTNAMNAYQREAYLPQNSQQTYGPEHEASAKKNFLDDVNWSAQQNALRSMPRSY